MRAIEKNIWVHPNGNYYFVHRRGKKMYVKSLRTKKISEARRKVFDFRIASLESNNPFSNGEQNLGHLVKNLIIYLRNLNNSKEPITVENKDNAKIDLDRNTEYSGLDGDLLMMDTRPTLTVGLEEHGRTMVLVSKSSQRMAATCRAIVLEYCQDWESFSCVNIWNQYRNKRINGTPITSGANHLLWFLDNLCLGPSNINILIQKN